MSMDFLQAICGNSEKARQSIVVPFEKGGEYPRIAWYPSAGWDLRPLLYLNDRYAEMYPGDSRDAAASDLFLFTDARGCPWKDEDYAYKDNRTQIKVVDIEDGGRFYIGETAGIAWLSEDHYEVSYQLLSVKSSKMKEPYLVRLVYVKSENEAFCSRIMLNRRARISHVLHKSYSGGLGGGGTARGAWLPGVLNRLNTEVYITDGRESIEYGDMEAILFYRNLAPERQMPVLEQFRVQEGRCWDINSEVTWYRLDRTEYEKWQHKYEVPDNSENATGSGDKDEVQAEKSADDIRGGD